MVRDGKVTIDYTGHVPGHPHASGLVYVRIEPPTLTLAVIEILISARRTVRELSGTSTPLGGWFLTDPATARQLALYMDSPAFHEGGLAVFLRTIGDGGSDAE